MLRLLRVLVPGWLFLAYRAMRRNTYVLGASLVALISVGAATAPGATAKATLSLSTAGKGVLPAGELLEIADEYTLPSGEVCGVGYETELENNVAPTVLTNSIGRLPGLDDPCAGTFDTFDVVLKASGKTSWVHGQFVSGGECTYRRGKFKGTFVPGSPATDLVIGGKAKLEAPASGPTCPKAIDLDVHYTIRAYPSLEPLILG
jgi:hypothetical protein